MHIAVCQEFPGGKVLRMVIDQVFSEKTKTATEVLGPDPRARGAPGALRARRSPLALLIACITSPCVSLTLAGCSLMTDGQRNEPLRAGKVCQQHSSPPRCGQGPAMIASTVDRFLPAFNLLVVLRIAEKVNQSQEEERRIERLKT